MSRKLNLALMVCLSAGLIVGLAADIASAQEATSPPTDPAPLILEEHGGQGCSGGKMRVPLST